MNKPVHLQINLHRLDGSVEEVHIHTDYDHELHTPLIEASNQRKAKKANANTNSRTSNTRQGRVIHGLHHQQAGH